MKVSSWVLVISLMTGMVLLSHAQDPFAQPEIQKIQARLQKGIEGDKEAVKKLVDDLEQWTQEQPDNHLLAAYLGSAYSLRSRDAWIGDKLSYLKKAQTTMNQAVAADPHNAAVRFIRAMNYYQLPAFLGKRQEARDDFHVLLRQLEGNPPPSLNLQTTQAIYYYAGLSYEQTQRLQAAKKAWERGVALAPKTRLGAEMKEKLQSLYP